MPSFNFSFDEETRIKEAGKHVMQAMVLQCQSLYTSGMTEETFIDAVYGSITTANRTREGINFFKQVYEHLVENRSSSNVYTVESGDVTLAICQRAVINRNARTNNQEDATWAFIVDGTYELVPVVVIVILIIAIILASSTPAR